MVRQMVTTALLLVRFSDSPHLGGIAVKVWGLVPFGVSEVELAPVGETVAVSAPMACVACGRRGGRRVACGVVLGCGFCAAVGVFMALTYKFSIIMI